MKRPRNRNRKSKVSAKKLIKDIAPAEFECKSTSKTLGVNSIKIMPLLSSRRHEKQVYGLIDYTENGWSQESDPSSPIEWLAEFSKVCA